MNEGYLVQKIWVVSDGKLKFDWNATIGHDGGRPQVKVAEVSNHHDERMSQIVLR